MPAADHHPSDDEQTELLRGLTELVRGSNTGAGGLVGLQLVIELAVAATNAAAASFIEYAEAGGRVVAVAGGVDFMLGRPVDMRSSAVTSILTGPPVQDLPMGEPGSGLEPLLAAGFRHTILVGVRVGGEVVGALQLHFRDDPRDAAGRHDASRRTGARIGEPAQSWVTLLAACAGHLYADQIGLPVHESGPRLSPLSLAIAVVGPSGTVRSWNPAAERLTAQRAAEVVGQPFPFPLPGPGRPVEHRMACGTWIRIRATRVSGSDAVALTMRPRADESDQTQARDLFLAVASHELRTPVTVIRGYADTLVEHWEALDEPARREAVLVMGQRARELSRLVDRLLTTASDAAGLLEGAPGVPFDVIDTLREVTNDLAPDVRAGVRLDLPAAVPKAAGDRAGIATVVTELVTNAVKYSPARVNVDVTAGADSQTVWFRVADRGVGIQSEHVERAFERFWQLERGDQRRYGGVGLGLYLVRRIVERQNGWVSLRPRDGGGTVAEVRLPRADASVGED
jgi:two-component system, OmpR family, phosphate regulon sensor histidine kinase PhoR